jgi:transaldolase
MLGAHAMCRESGRQIELLWASTREAYNVTQAAQAGCDIITAPADILKKVRGFGKDLLELSLETVRTFKADSEAAGFSL